MKKFIQLQDIDRSSTHWVNPAFIVRVSQRGIGNGTVVSMTDGQSITVNHTKDDIARMIDGPPDTGTVSVH